MNQTIDEYLSAVRREVACSPAEFERISADLRAHFEDLRADGHSEAEALHRLGPPGEVAAELLATGAPTFEYARPAERFGAALLDWGMAFTVAALWVQLRREAVLVEDIITLSITATIATYVLNMLYYPLLDGHQRGSIGKRLFGLAVVRTSGERIGSFRALVRRIPYLIPSEYPVATLEALSIFATQRRQRLMDLLVDSIVVRSNRSTWYRLRWLLVGIVWVDVLLAWWNSIVFFLSMYGHFVRAVL